MDELQELDGQSAPVWAIFSDLMAALVGILALILVWVIAIQFELTQDLEAEKQRRQALERALADPLASGRITFQDGRIGISGNLLFRINSADLQSGGNQVLQDLAEPLKVYLSQHDELLMVSGFTDDLSLHEDNLYRDNWGLSAQRALTVTRTLVEQGLPQDRLFVAAFGANAPTVPNRDAASRAKNRRVEISTVPRREHEAAVD